MLVTTETNELFSSAKCILIENSLEKMTFTTPLGEHILFFYPSRDKLTVNKIVGRDETSNIPIVRTEINDSEWVIRDNRDLATFLKNWIS